MIAPSTTGATRNTHFRELVRGRTATWAFLIGTSVAVVGGGMMGDVRVALLGPIVTVLLIVAIAYRTAGERAEKDFFGALAPRLGLTYMVSGAHVPITPLLAAGERRRFEHVMEGPLFGREGGPPCMLAHYTYETRQSFDTDERDSGTWTPHRFTVCAIDLGAPLARYRGLYLRRRLSGLGLEHDWLDRAPKPRAIELESQRFNEIYDLRAGVDQDDIALRELFSPAFVMWLADHPIKPGFECKAGTLAVFLPGHEESADRLAFFFETARDIARRIKRQTESRSTGAPVTITAGLPSGQRLA